jgi:hypothetical protein
MTAEDDRTLIAVIQRHSPEPVDAAELFPATRKARGGTWPEALMIAGLAIFLASFLDVPFLAAVVVALVAAAVFLGLTSRGRGASTYIGVGVGATTITLVETDKAPVDLQRVLPLRSWPQDAAPIRRRSDGAFEVQVTRQRLMVLQPPTRSNAAVVRALERAAS